MIRGDSCFFDGHAPIYIGRDLIPVNPAEVVPDETEFLEVGILPFAEVLQRVLDSDIRDSMTVIAVLWAAYGQSKGLLQNSEPM